MDRVLLSERSMENVYSTFNCQSLTTLTLYAPMVVSEMDRVLLSERVMEEYVSSTYNPQLLSTLTLYAPMVVP